jgi:hypothetical protein
MIQPIKDRVHPAYEYWGQSDPTREINRKVSKEKMAARVSQMYSGKVKVKKCPKAHSLKRPADPVRSCDLPLGHFTSLVSCVGRVTPLSSICRSARFRCGAQHLFLK